MAFAVVIISNMRDVTDTRAHAFDRTHGFSVSRLWPIVCTGRPRDYHQTDAI